MSTTVIGGRYWYGKEDKSGEGNYGAVYRAYDIKQSNYNQEEEEEQLHLEQKKWETVQIRKSASQSQLQSMSSNVSVQDQHDKAASKHRENDNEDNNIGMHMSNLLKHEVINENALESDVTNVEQIIEEKEHAVNAAPFIDKTKNINTNNLENFSGVNDENSNSNSNNNNKINCNNVEWRDTQFDTSDIVALKIMENKYESSGIDTSVIHEIMILHKIAQEYAHYTQSKRQLCRCSVDTTAADSKNPCVLAVCTPLTTTTRNSTFTNGINNVVQVNGHVKSGVVLKSVSREANESDFALQSKPLLRFLQRQHHFVDDKNSSDDDKLKVETNVSKNLHDSKLNVESSFDTSLSTRNEAVYNPLHTFYFPTQLSECEFSLQNDTNDISITTKSIKANNADTTSLESQEKENNNEMCNLEERNQFECEENNECKSKQELSLIDQMVDYYNNAAEVKNSVECKENKNTMEVNKKIQEEHESGKTVTRPEKEGDIKGNDDHRKVLEVVQHKKIAVAKLENKGVIVKNSETKSSKANTDSHENVPELLSEKSFTLHSVYIDEKVNDKQKLYSDNAGYVNDQNLTKCNDVAQVCQEAMPRQNRKKINQKENYFFDEQKQCEERIWENQESEEKELKEEQLHLEKKDLYYCVDAALELMQSGVEHIVQMRDVIIDSEHNSVYLIMEYCDGGNLRRYLQRLPEHKITDKALYRRWSAEITSALAFLHSQHISHCDLKTENILLQRQLPLSLEVQEKHELLEPQSSYYHEENQALQLEQQGGKSSKQINSLHSSKNNAIASEKSLHTSNGSSKKNVKKCNSTVNHSRNALKEINTKDTSNFILKLCDFGLSHVEDIPVKKFKHPAVTLWYRPPDVLLNNMYYTYTADAWSLGCVLLEMAVGVAPFRAFNEYEELKCIFKRLGKPTKRNFPSAHQYPCPSLLLTLIDFDETDTNEIVKANFSKKSSKDGKESNNNKTNFNNSTSSAIEKKSVTDTISYVNEKENQNTHKQSKNQMAVNTKYCKTHVIAGSTTVNNSNEGWYDSNNNSTVDTLKISTCLPSQDENEHYQNIEKASTKTILEENVQEVRRRLKKYLQAHNSLKVLGRSGLDLVSRLLQYEPAYRLSVMDALHHPFFSNEAQSLCARRFSEFHMLCKEEQELELQHLAERAVLYAQGQKELLQQSLQLPSPSSLQSTPIECLANAQCRSNQEHLVSSHSVMQESILEQSENTYNVDLEKSSAKCLKQTPMSSAEKSQGNNNRSGGNDNNTDEIVNSNVESNNRDNLVEEKERNSFTTFSLQMSSWPPLLEPLDCPLPLPLPRTTSSSFSSFLLHDIASSTSLSTYPESSTLAESSFSLPSQENKPLCNVESRNEDTQVSLQDNRNNMESTVEHSTPSISSIATKSITSASSTVSEKYGLVASHTGYSTFALVPPSCQAIRYHRNSRELPPLPLPQRHHSPSMENKHVPESHPLSTSWQMLTSSSSSSTSSSSAKSKEVLQKIDPLRHEKQEQLQREKQCHQCEYSVKQFVQYVNENVNNISKEGKDNDNKKQLHSDDSRVNASKRNTKLSPITELESKVHVVLSEEMQQISVSNTPTASIVENNSKLDMANNESNRNTSNGSIAASNNYRITHYNNENKQSTKETSTEDANCKSNKVNNLKKKVTSNFVTQLCQIHNKFPVEERNNTSRKKTINKMDDKPKRTTTLMKTADQNDFHDIS